MDKEEIKNQIGINIRNRRIELGLTQEELASRLGYKSKSTVNKVETGINDITQSKIQSYATALHTTVEYILGINNDTSEPTTTTLEDQLLTSFNLLNDTGQNKAVDYVLDLSELDRYRR